MDDRTLFARFHDAFDIQPRPGSFDRMRIALLAPPAMVKPRPAFRMRFGRTGFRVAAAVTVAILIIVALATYVALHRPASSSYVPAHTGADVKAYQDLTSRGFFTVFMAESDHCYYMTDTACASSAAHFNAAVQTWLDGLKNTKAPAEFAQIDFMLRAHLTATLADGNATVAAQKARNAALFDAAGSAYQDVRYFGDTISKAITGARPATAAEYRATVKDQVDLFKSCTPCGPYTGADAIACTGMQLVKCASDMIEVDADVYTFEAELVQAAAPSSLAVQDAHLQADLVNADAAALAMIHAGLLGDVAGFNAARTLRQAEVSTLNVDAAAVTHG